VTATEEGICIDHARGSDTLHIPTKQHADVLDTLSTWATNAVIADDPVTAKRAA
jgi:hypothetical protein